MKKIFILLLFQTINETFSSICENQFEETVCENFSFSPDLILNTTTNKLTIKNAKGNIIHENFSKLDQITEIKITTSDIAKIEPETLCCLPNLTSINIVNNVNFPKITRKVLQGCQQIKRIYLSGVTLTNGAFTDVKNLQSLSLNGTIGSCILNLGLEYLKSLTIRHTCDKITKQTFRGLKNVTFLDLQSNKIESIENGAFRELPQLKLLNLSDNKLKNLTWTEFEGLKALKVLFLERNDFSDVDVDKLVSSVPNLERIFFSYDRLSIESRRKIEDKLPKLNITFIYIGKPL